MTVKEQAGKKFCQKRKITEKQPDTTNQTKRALLNGKLLVVNEGK